MDLSTIQKNYSRIREEAAKVIAGQDDILHHLIIGLLLQGHILLESVPGLGKSLMVEVLARLIGGSYKRIQFTPDLMPSDIIGTTIYHSEIDDFRIKKGPVFTNILLADEINRASAKTQSALLEAMAEGQVSIGNETLQLEPPFLCLATQNPIEMEGTYPLPEAQQDRFMMKLIMDYPGEDQEKQILNNYLGGFDHRDLDAAGLKPVCKPKDITAMGRELKKIKVEEKIVNYITELVRETRGHMRLLYGSSPRGAVSLLLASQASAALEGRDYVTPDDVKALAVPVIQHRVVLSPDAELSGQTSGEILREILDTVKVPRS
jgi:MoxR-like ATPase